MFNEQTRTLHFLPLAHILARSIQPRRGAQPGAPRAHRRHQEPRPATGRVPAHRGAVRAPGIREDLQHRQAQGGGGGQGAHLRPGRPLRDRLQPGPRQRRPGPHCSACATRSSTGWSTAGLRAALGGQVRWSVSGGAPLGARLGHFFRGIGITVLEGYGLTETCAGVTLNLPARQRIGSVGRPIPGCTIRIADDGEVLIKGGDVFTGYWRNDEATQEVFDADGWFHSGDLGELDDGGYLTITGRKKDLIITSSGKNVAPAVLEDRLARTGWSASASWSATHGPSSVRSSRSTPTRSSSGSRTPEAGSRRRGGPACGPAALRPACRKRWTTPTRPCRAPRRSRPSGCWTPTSPRRVGKPPTLKVKRNIVLASFDEEVEALYRR